MPANFVRAERAIAKKIRSGEIPKYYYKQGKKYKSSSDALARVATKFYGPAQERKKAALRKRKLIYG